MDDLEGQYMHEEHNIKVPWGFKFVREGWRQEHVHGEDTDIV